MSVNQLYEAVRREIGKVIFGQDETIELALAALLSAFMATFSALVNGAASYLIRDIYQHYLNPKASDRRLVFASKIASVLMIAVGIGISFVSDSINTMITWILGYLGSAVIVPNVLRWYWWRLNGAGYAAGMFAGMVLLFLITSMAPVFAPSLIMTFEVFIGLIQAFVFGMLTLVFMAQATQGHGDNHHE